MEKIQNKLQFKNEKKTQNEMKSRKVNHDFKIPKKKL